MTVSKALRDEPDVSTATKLRVKQLALQTGYVPDSSAQGLRTKTTKLFGVVIPATTNAIYARIVYAIEERAHDLGYDLLLAHTHNQPEREEVCLRHLLSRRVDGLFISPVYRYEAEARIYQEIRVRATPTLLLGPPAPFCRFFPTIEIEELIASYNLTRHLLKLGHRRIAYLTGPTVAPWAHERFEGYRRALREANIEVDDKLVFSAGNTIEEGTKAALQLLNEGCPPPPSRPSATPWPLAAPKLCCPRGCGFPRTSPWPALATSWRRNTSACRSPPCASPSSGWARRRWTP